ncbi:DUF1887 family protein [Tolypothrix campylonemoides VB511288]|nr:DUF1887 family protein [Tolypothrix campylonemoides VB511288]
MSTSDFDEYKVNHLFLLVGENPLPNYVAARLLLKNSGCVHLVYTTRTKKWADLLQKELEKLSISVKRIELGASWNGYDIEKKIKEKISPKGKLVLEGRIGLNYTGGTKVMAVHAYQALLELELVNPVFSYLDSTKLQMCIDDNEQRTTKTIPAALALSPPPKLEEILRLHNLSWQVDNPPIPRSQLPIAAVEFAKQFMHGQSGMWKKWCDAVFKSAKNASGYWLKDNELPQPLRFKLSVDISREEKVKVPDEIKKILRETLQCASDIELDIQLLKDRWNFNDLSQVFQWLNGGWLEDYVLWQVEEISKKKPAYSIHDMKMSLHIQDPAQPRQNDQFEFDVAFLRGYQLFAISCTTTYKHDYCKEKLFEAYQRAQQLGGDEARVALVCCYDNDTNYLKQELSFVVDDRKIEVFGRSDLEPVRFARKLDNWIYRNI